MEEKFKLMTSPRKRLRSANHWSFFFVDDTGRVFYFDRIKSLAFSLLIFLILAVVTAGFAVKIALDLNRGKLRLNRELSVLKQETKQLKEENEDLSLKLIEKNTRESKNIAIDKVEDEKIPDSVPEKSPENMPVNNDPNVTENTADAGNPDSQISADGVKAETPAPLPSTGQKPVTFEVNNFFVSHNQETKMLNVQFKLSKVSGKKGKTAGQTVVVLNGKMENNETRLIMPVEATVDKNLAKAVNGKPFFISSYNYIRMSMDYQMDIKSLRNATILVFDDEGNLILEENFPITIK